MTCGNHHRECAMVCWASKITSTNVEGQAGREARRQGVRHLRGVEPSIQANVRAMSSQPGPSAGARPIGCSPPIRWAADHALTSGGTLDRLRQFRERRHCRHGRSIHRRPRGTGLCWRARVPPSLRGCASSPSGSPQWPGGWGSEVAWTTRPVIRSFVYNPLLTFST